MQRKPGLILFLTACIPGCGQMYQGYMKRGVSLLCAACLTIVLAVTLNLGELAVLLPVVWLYAFFDSYNLRGQLEWGAAPRDEFLFGLEGLTGEKLNRVCSQRRPLIGGILLALGIYSLYRTVLGGVMRHLAEAYNLWWLYELTINQLPRILVTVGVILLGAWFIRGPRQNTSEEDYQSFTPPSDDTDRKDS